MKQLFKNSGMQNIEELDGRVKEMAVLLEKVQRGALSEEEVRDLISELCLLQNEQGGWCITDTTEMPGDARFDYFYIPAMYATAILIETMKLLSSKESLCLAKALALLEERRMEGHGYNAIKGYLRGVSILHKSIGKADQEELRKLCPRFARMWKTVQQNLRKIQNSETSWWIDEDDKEKATKLLREFKMNGDQGKNSQRLYFAYGSNMSEEQMRDRCKDACLIGPAYIENYRLSFRKSFTDYYATLDSAPGEKVEGLLWIISQSDEKELDRCEGVHRTDCYRKKTVDIQTKNGGSRKALVYVLSEDRPQDKPNDSYFDKLQKAYKKYSFDKLKLEEARNRSNIASSN